MLQAEAVNRPRVRRLSANSVSRGSRKLISEPLAILCGSFFTDKLGLPLEWRQEDADFAGLRLPSGQLLEAFGLHWADNYGWYDGAHPSTSPILGFEVEDV